MENNGIKREVCKVKYGILSKEEMWSIKKEEVM